MKVKIISRYDEDVFEKDVSDFYTNKDVILIRKVVYNTTFSKNNEILYTAFIEYE